MKISFFRKLMMVGLFSGAAALTLSPADARADDGDRPGKRPSYVKCDPAQPDMPCTPDAPPPDVDRTPTRKGGKPGGRPDYVKCDPAQPDMPCTPDAPPPDLD